MSIFEDGGAFFVYATECSIYEIFVDEIIKNG
jgi:hypothetical protein